MPYGEKCAADQRGAHRKSADAHFQNYHRVLNRAQWSSHEAGRMLLGLLLDAFVPEGPVVMGLDETIE
jgi:hypothetical protein